MVRYILISTACLAVAACQSTNEAAQVDPLTAAISGKTLVSEGGEFTLGSNGSLTGMSGPNRDTEVTGAWEIRDGRYCRTITQPERLAGTACQDITLNDDGTVTIDGINGPVVFALR